METPNPKGCMPHGITHLAHLQRGEYSCLVYTRHVASQKYLVDKGCWPRWNSLGVILQDRPVGTVVDPEDMKHLRSIANTNLQFPYCCFVIVEF